MVRKRIRPKLIVRHNHKTAVRSRLIEIVFNVKSDKKQENYTYGHGFGNFDKLIGAGLSIFYSVESKKAEEQKPEYKKQ